VRKLGAYVLHMTFLLKPHILIFTAVYDAWLFELSCIGKNMPLNNYQKQNY